MSVRRAWSRVFRIEIRLGLMAALGLAVVIAAHGCLKPVTEPPTRTLIVYGFSILGETLNKGIFPAFAEQWLEERGERIQLLGAFAGSGTVTNQILFGAPADVAILSHEVDALRLRRAGIIRTDWRTFPHRGVVNRTPFVIVTRPGNPLGIRDFADLARPGTEIAHPDPLTSGGALWSILAEYGSALAVGRSPEEAEAQLLGIWRNVRYQAASARAVRTQFETGFGDALITYEQETLDRPIRGEVIYPPATILSEHIAVLVDRNVSPDEAELARAFLDYLWSPQAQRIFAEYGFRSADEELNAQMETFPRIEQPFTVEDLGGWETAQRRVVEGVWKERILTEVRRR